MRHVGRNAILRVRWSDGAFAWYRVARSRNVETLKNYFLNRPGFSYAKLYEYDKKTKTVLSEIGFFGVNKNTGEIYGGGIF